MSYAQSRMVGNYETICNIQITIFQLIYAVSNLNVNSFGDLYSFSFWSYLYFHQLEFFLRGAPPLSLLLTSKCQKFLWYLRVFDKQTQKKSSFKLKVGVAEKEAFRICQARTSSYIFELDQEPALIMNLSHLDKHCSTCRGEAAGLTTRPKLGKHRPWNGKRMVKVIWWQWWVGGLRNPTHTQAAPLLEQSYTVCFSREKRNHLDHTHLALWISEFSQIFRETLCSLGTVSTLQSCTHCLQRKQNSRFPDFVRVT